LALSRIEFHDSLISIDLLIKRGHAQSRRRLNDFFGELALVFHRHAFGDIE
jgi:hypothetical protein